MIETSIAILVINPLTTKMYLPYIQRISFKLKGNTLRFH